MKEAEDELEHPPPPPSALMIAWRLLHTRRDRRQGSRERGARLQDGWRVGEAHRGFLAKSLHANFGWSDSMRRVSLVSATDSLEKGS